LSHEQFSYELVGHRSNRSKLVPFTVLIMFSTMAEEKVMGV